MRSLFHGTAIAVLAIAIPAVSLADITGTPTLAANTTLNFDTGATGSSGGDVLWSGSSLSFQSNAAGFNFPGGGGLATYNSLVQQTLAAFPYAKTAIPAASLTVNAVFAVHTNAGNYAKALVTAASGTSLTLQFTTYGASTTPTGPTITAIQNNYSYIQSGFPNYGIAPGTIFIVKGTGLADPAAQAVLQTSASPGIPLTLNGASATVTVNGVTTHPGFYYAIATQLALVLPSNTPIGNGTLTITYNNTTSQPANILVAPSAFGLMTYYGTGSGLGKATDPFTGVPYFYTNSASPGQIVVLWGSGLGGITADSDTTFTGTPHASNSPLQIFIGGIQASIGYQGNSGFPGLNQINVTIPASVLPGCNVSLVAVSGNIVSNTVTLPIATGGGACSDPVFGVSGAQLQTRSGQSTVRSGFLFIAHASTPTGTSDTALASFQSVTGSTYGSGGGAVSVGGCIVSQNVGSSSTSTSTGLNAGNIIVTGPAGSVTLAAIPSIVGTYFAQPAAGFFPASGGTFTFNATAGTDVGSFNATVNLTNPMVWTNTSANATVTRSQGTPITWTGGTANSFVYITGSSSATVAGQSVSGSYTCYAPVSAGQFSVPSWALLGLPAGTGTTMVENGSAYQSFSASGIDYGYTFGAVSQTVNTTFN